MASVIIPAHNEGSVILRTLDSIFSSNEKLNKEVIVVCNGCSDNTAELARSYSSDVTVIEVETPSKTNALNVGDQHASQFPRIYMDADIELREDALFNLVKAMEQNNCLAASPVVETNFDGCSFVVKSFYRFWQALPYCREGMIGTGVFAISEKGREKFDQFPSVIADDGYVRAMYSAEERISVPNSGSIVRAPRKLYDLIKIKTRSRLGRYELDIKFPGLSKSENKDYKGAMLRALLRIDRWHQAAIYLTINLITRMRAKRMLKEQNFSTWERDNSSR